MQYNQPKTIRWVLLTAIILCSNSNIYSQEANKARHFIGLHGGADLTTTSVFSGISYEYLITAQKRTELGVKLTYTFPYQLGNFILLYPDRSAPRLSELGLLLSVNYFTNKQKINTGFFIAAQAGSIFSGDTGFPVLVPGERTVDGTLGVGFGWKWPLKGGQAIRWTNMITGARQ